MIYISPLGQYPRHYGDIQNENPGWSLGDPLPDGWAEVSLTERPLPELNKIIYEDYPELINGSYYQKWIVRDMTDAEINRQNAPVTIREKLKLLGLTDLEIDFILSAGMR